MSEPIPESVPTSAIHRSRPPKKKIALTPATQQSAQVEALFANPERAGSVINMGPKPKVLAAPPEIVASVQGSSAGAGSGEFHVYKASRRREYERLRIMDEENQAEEAEKEFQQRKEAREREEEERLKKNRAKRDKLKQRQQKKKQGTSTAVDTDAECKTHKPNDVRDVGSNLKRKLGAAKIAKPGDAGAINSELDLPPDGDVKIVAEDAGITIHDDD